MSLDFWVVQLFICAVFSILFVLSIQEWRESYRGRRVVLLDGVVTIAGLSIGKEFMVNAVVSSFRFKTKLWWPEPEIPILILEELDGSSRRYLVSLDEVPKGDYPEGGSIVRVDLVESNLNRTYRLITVGDYQERQIMNLASCFGLVKGWRRSR